MVVFTLTSFCTDNVNALNRSLSQSQYSRNASTDNKKLLHDRKRHTARCVASTRSAVLSRGGGGVVSQSCPGRGGGGYPCPAVPPSQPGLGYPSSWDWSTPPPPVGTGYPPQAGNGVASLPPGKDLGPETRERTWDWGIPP